MGEERRTAVLLDEHPMWLAGLERLVENVGFRAIGKFTSPPEALALIEREAPDLFVLDIDATTGHLDGLEALKGATELAPSMKSLVVSTSDEAERIDAAFAAGAVGYVLKRAEPEDLTSAMRQVFERSLYLASSPQLPAPRVADAAGAGLTRREREILKLVAEGMTNGDVARHLWVTEQTVKFHLANIFRKLNVTNRTQASRWAHSHGLLLDDQPSEPPGPTRLLAVS